jgi:hypothetical protein
MASTIERLGRGVGFEGHWGASCQLVAIEVLGGKPEQVGDKAEIDAVGGLTG